jgi:hypothetical protein
MVKLGNKRDWKLMHRYIFHHIFLADGMQAVIGVVCQPHTWRQCYKTFYGRKLRLFIIS